MEVQSVPICFLLLSEEKKLKFFSLSVQIG